MAVGNLEFIKSAETTSSVSELAVTTCFTSDYDVYKIVCTGISTATAFGEIYNIRLLDNTSTQISANYDYAALEMRASASFIERPATGDTDFRFVTKAYSNPQEGNFVMYIYNPTDTGSYTFVNWQSAGFSGSANLNGNYKGIGVLKDTQEVTGLKLIGDAGSNIDKAKISVYGLASN